MQIKNAVNWQNNELLYGSPRRRRGSVVVKLALTEFLQYFISRPIQHLIAATAELAKDESNARSDIRGHGGRVINGPG